MISLQAAILVEPLHIDVRELPIPTPGPGEVVIRVRAALTCGTDLKAYLRGHPQIPMPGPFGHEYSGDVASVGSGVAVFTPGDPVMGVHSAPCLDCYWCHRGQSNLCAHVMDNKVLGAYAEYLRIPAHIVKQNLFTKPESLSYEEAALLEPLSCVVFGLHQVPISADDTVVLIGAGPIALLFLSVLRAMGVRHVIMTGRRDIRLEAATSMGADQTVNATSEDVLSVVMDATDGRGADLVIECTGQVPVWESAVDLSRRGGHVILFGGPPVGSMAQFDTSRLHYDQITLHSPFHFTPQAVQEARQLLLSRRLKLSSIISGRLDLAETAEAFTRLHNGEGLKYNLVPGRASAS